MKIISLINTRIPTEKAYGYQVARVCCELARLGADVELWAPVKKKNTVMGDLFDYYKIDRNFSVKYINNIPFSNFFLHRISFFITLLFTRIPKGAVVYTRSPELSFLFGMRGHPAFYAAHNFPKRGVALLKILLSRSSGIVCNSSGTEAVFRRNGFTHTIVIRNGVDLEEFILPFPQKEAREKLKLPQDKRIILYSGHLYAWKGVDTVLESARLSREDETVLFVLVGGTKKDIDIYRTRIEKMRLMNILLVGHVERNLIPVYLRASDVTLLPNTAKNQESAQYTSPIKMFEYMASGIPIVASRLPSTEEVLHQGNALLVPPDDAQALLEGIKKVLSDKTFAASIAAQGRKEAGQFTWRAHAEALRQFLRAA